jgi:serine protease Do
MPQAELASQALSSAPLPTKDFTIIGMTMRSLKSDELRKHGLENGLLVTNVSANSPGNDAAIRPGDLLIKADDILLKSGLDFEIAVKNAKKNKKKALLVLVNRDDRNRFTGIALD